MDLSGESTLVYRSSVDYHLVLWVFQAGNMKTVLLSFLMACAAVTSPASDDTPFSGKWHVSIEIGGTSVDHVCTFTQKGQDLTGSCDTQNGTVNLSGKVDQKKITWTYKSQSSSNGVLTVIYDGTLDLTTGTTRITGSVLVEEMGIRGTFTANQAK
jgi:hypothetical protein